MSIKLNSLTLFCRLSKLSVFSVILICLNSLAIAEVAPANLEKTPGEAWVGERVAFYISLRSPATFSGTATFDIPQIAGTSIIQIGSPVVSSEKIEDEQWSIQRHEFALFCQRAGTLKVPDVSVNFTRKETFTGPEKEVTGVVSGWSIEIQQPPESEKIGHLITTDEFDVTEVWSPSPGVANVGDVFKRTITQRASNVSGMALAPASQTVPKEMKFYPGDVQTNDTLVRGDFRGERQETVTYLVTGDGEFSLPAIKYVWWNPKLKELQSKTLLAAAFQVKPAPVDSTDHSKTSESSSWILVSSIFVIFTAFIFIASQRSRIQELAFTMWRRLNPPERVAGRQLLRACRMNDVDAAETAWIQWRLTQDSKIQTSKELASQVTEMHRFRFAKIVIAPWKGERLAVAFRKHLKESHVVSEQQKKTILPSLNP